MLRHNLTRLRNDLPDLIGKAGCLNAHVNVRRAHAQFLKENVAQIWVIILSGMDEDVFAKLVEFGNNGAQANDFGTCPEDGHHFHAVIPLPAYWRSRYCSSSEERRVGKEMSMRWREDECR